MKDKEVKKLNNYKYSNAEIFRHNVIISEFNSYFYKELAKGKLDFVNGK